MTEVIVEQPLASPGSANYVVLVKDIVSPKDIQIGSLVQKLSGLLNWLISSCWWSFIKKGLCGATEEGLFL